MFCLKWDCMLFQKPIHLPLRVLEEGRAKAFSRGRNNQHHPLGLSVLRMVRPVSHTVHSSAWTDSRDTGCVSSTEMTQGSCGLLLDYTLGVI